MNQIIIMAICFISLPVLSQGYDDAFNTGSVYEAVKGAPEDEAVLPVDPEVTKKTKNNLKKANEVQNEVDGIFFVENNNKFTIGQQAIFVKSERDTVTVAARGSVIGINSRSVLIELISDSIVKLPYPGDLVVPIALPWDPSKAAEDNDAEDPYEVVAPPIDPDPGHVQLTLGRIFGDLSVDTPNQTNSLKKPGFNFTYFNFQWYFEFLSNLGIEFESYSGFYPTKDFNRNDVNTTQDYFSISINYRFKKNPSLWGLRPEVRLISFVDRFETENSDEYIISSTYSGFGIGFRAAKEYSQLLWKSKKKSDWKLHNVYAELNYNPVVNPKDTILSRGALGSGTAYDMRVGSMVFLQTDIIPYVKRFHVAVVAGLKSYDLSFSGPTVSETGGVYTIPEGGNYTESSTYIMINLGMRMDDKLGKFLQPR